MADGGLLTPATERSICPSPPSRPFCPAGARCVRCFLMFPRAVRAPLFSISFVPGAPACRSIDSPRGSSFLPRRRAHARHVPQIYSHELGPIERVTACRCVLCMIDPLRRACPLSPGRRRGGGGGILPCRHIPCSSASGARAGTGCRQQPLRFFLLGSTGTGTWAARI
jgi:hypothetical protein